MSRSKGTKATQGINGDAAALQRWNDALAGDARLSPRRHGGNKDEQADSLQRWMGSVPASLALVGEPCPYEHHRASDWVTPTSQVICGVCHPPAAEFDGIQRRDEDGFDELALEARERVIPRDRHVEDLEPRAQRLELEQDGDTVDAETIAPALRNLLRDSTRTLEAGLEDLEAELAEGLDAALEVDR
jgi:hypothetical protein